MQIILKSETHKVDLFNKCSMQIFFITLQPLVLAMCLYKHACINLTKYSSDLQFQFRNVFQKQQTVNVMNKTPYTEIQDKRSCNLGGHGVTYISVTSPSWYFSEKVSSNLKYLVQPIQTLMIQYYSHDAELSLQLMFSKLLSQEITKMVQSILYYQLLLCCYLKKAIF